MLQVLKEEGEEYPVLQTTYGQQVPIVEANMAAGAAIVHVVSMVGGSTSSAAGRAAPCLRGTHAHGQRAGSSVFSVLANAPPPGRPLCAHTHAHTCALCTVKEAKYDRPSHPLQVLAYGNMTFGAMPPSDGMGGMGPMPGM